MRTKTLLISLLFVALLFGMASCEKDHDSSEGLSTITYFPEFTMTGDAEMFLNKGGSFTDPGVKAMEKGKEIDVSVNVTGAYSGYNGDEVETNVVDNYTVSYSAINSDGYPGKTKRAVWVFEDGDLTTGLQGLYTTTIVRDGTPAFTNVPYVLIWSLSATTFELQCGVGGYYDVGKAYGPGYAARGAVVTVNNLATNDFSVTDAKFPLWGNTVTITGFTVDASAKTISYTGTGDWGSVFEVTLTQVEK